jgi:hypothetical protein
LSPSCVRSAIARFYQITLFAKRSAGVAGCTPPTEQWLQCSIAARSVPSAGRAHCRLAQTAGRSGGEAQAPFRRHRERRRRTRRPDAQGSDRRVEGRARSGPPDRGFGKSVRADAAAGWGKAPAAAPSYAGSEISSPVRCSRSGCAPTNQRACRGGRRARSRAVARSAFGAWTKQRSSMAELVASYDYCRGARQTPAGTAEPCRRPGRIAGRSRQQVPPTHRVTNPHQR